MSREVLTFQLGNYANFIGTHWWNIQEAGFNYDAESEPSEVNHDVLYREGVNLNRETTYTPRLLLVDLKGSLKHLPREGELYGHCYKRSLAKKEKAANEVVKKLKEDLEWKQTEVEVLEQPVEVPNDFQKDIEDPAVDLEEKDYKLADSVDSWADFLYARFHPRTVNIVNEYQHDVNKQTFDTYSSGVQLWSKEQFEDDFCDKIRQYVEECNFMQGFQIIFDAFNGHSGLATKCLEHVNDEYGKATFAVPVYAPKSMLYESADEPMSDSIRVVNSALSFSGLAEHASLFVPLSTSERAWRQIGSACKFPNSQFHAENLYQTSGILAAFLETITARYRLRNAPMSNSLAGFCGDLNNYGRKLAAAAFSLPFPMLNDMDLIDCLDKFEGPLFKQLTPNCSIGTNYIVQSLTVRGIPHSRLKRPYEQAKEQMRMAAYKCSSVSEMFQLYFQCNNHASMSHVTSLQTPLPTRMPFPNEIFTDNIDANGFVNSFVKRPTTQKVLNVPALAAVQSSNELGDTLETLHREAKRIKLAKVHRFRAAGLEDDDYVEALESLLQFKDNYEDNMEL